MEPQWNPWHDCAYRVVCVGLVIWRKPVGQILPALLFLEQLYKSKMGPETSAKNHCGFSWDQVGYVHPSWVVYAHMYMV